MEWWQITLTGCAGIITLLTLWEKLESRFRVAKQPTESLENEIENMKKQYDRDYRTLLENYNEVKRNMTEYDARFARDYDAINSINKTMKLVVKSQWVLVDHAQNGNNTKELENVGKELEKFIFD